MGIDALLVLSAVSGLLQLGILASWGNAAVGMLGQLLYYKLNFVNYRDNIVVNSQPYPTLPFAPHLYKYDMADKPRIAVRASCGSDWHLEAHGHS